MPKTKKGPFKEGKSSGPAKLGTKKWTPGDPPYDVKFFLPDAGHDPNVSKWFTMSDVWPRGDCTMAGGAYLIINADGTSSFTGRIRSTDGNDEWHMKFHFKTHDGAMLLELPGPDVGNDHTFWSYHMNDDSTWYTDFIDITFNGAHQDAIRGIFPSIGLVAWLATC